MTKYMRLLFSNGNIYVGGEFTNIGGAKIENRIAAIDTGSSSATIMESEMQNFLR
jgi:hypothetical protein